MIISHRQKFAFFRPPKNGTTTATFFLRICGAFDEHDTLSGMRPQGMAPSANLDQDEYVAEAHYTPKQAIDAGLITLDQLREYRSVAVLRNPVNRTLSALIHQSGRFCDPSYISLIVNNYEGDFSRLLEMRQSDWFYVDGELVLEPLLMDNYESHLREIINHVGGVDFPVLPTMNERSKTRGYFTMEQWLTPEFLDFVHTNYADDISLYNTIKAGERK